MQSGKLTPQQLLSRNILRGIKARGWSQRELARHAEIDPKTVNNAVNMVGSPLHENIEAMARALGTSADLLLSHYYDPADITYPQIERLVGNYLNADDNSRENILRVSEMGRPRTNTR